jgi:hypothetical protein
MPFTREIPKQGWETFLHAFSERNQGRPVRLEATVQPGEGEPLLSEHQSLMGVDLDPKGSEAPSLTLTLGGLNASMPEFTHRVSDPARVWVEEEGDGQAIALAIESEEEGKTLLIFEREAALPPGR